MDFPAKIRGMLDASADVPIADLIGLELLLCEDGEARFRMKATARHHNPMGTMHGGVLCDLADAAMGMAFASTLGDGEAFTTINLQINFLASVIEADLQADAKVIRRGKSMGFVEARVVDDDDRLIATAQCSCKVLKPR